MVARHFHLLRVGAGCSTLQFPDNYPSCFKFVIFYPLIFPKSLIFEGQIDENEMYLIGTIEGQTTPSLQAQLTRAAELP